MDDRTHRIRLKMVELAASVARQKGAVWEAVCGVRTRWDIEAQAQIPPPTREEGAYYAPHALSEDRLSEWDGELLALYGKFIPGDCRGPVGADVLNWLKFFSALVFYDPPIADGDGMRGLPEFCNALDHPRVSIRLLTGHRTLTPAWVSPLLGSVRDAQKVEELPRASALLVIAALQRQPDALQDRTPEEVWDELRRHDPGLAEKLQRLPDEIAPRRLLLDHEAGDTAKELHGALDKLITTRPEPPKRAGGGSKLRRDPAVAAEAAILFARRDWSQERVAEFYGWLRHGHDYSLASQWIEDGKEIASKL